MQVLDLPYLAELTALRRDLHAHPETAFHETRTAQVVAKELAAYGLLTGLLYPLFLRLLNKKTHLPAMLCALIGAMIGGRAVGGAAKALLLALGVIGSKAPFTFAAFLTGYFVETAVGAAIHVVLVPAIVLALERAKLSPMFMKEK